MPQTVITVYFYQLNLFSFSSFSVTTKSNTIYSVQLQFDQNYLYNAWNYAFYVHGATAVPLGTAEHVLAMGILSVCLSVCHDPVPIQAKVR